MWANEPQALHWRLAGMLLAGVVLIKSLLGQMGVCGCGLAGMDVDSECNTTSLKTSSLYSSTPLHLVSFIRSPYVLIFPA